MTDPKEPSRHGCGELDIDTVKPGFYLPWPCGECGSQMVELLLVPTRLHCEKCRAVVVLDLRNLSESDFWERDRS